MQLRWIRYGVYGAAITTLGASFLAGCGDDTNEGGSTSSSTTQTTTTTTTTTTGSTTTASSSSGGGTKGVGESCTTNDECAGGTCITEGSTFGWAGGYCTQLCDPRLNPCVEGDCLSTGGASSICVKTCDPSVASECNGKGQACVDISQEGRDPATYCFGGCTDGDCAATEKCDPSVGEAGACIPLEVCSGGTDEDGDGFIDCEDPDCAADGTCTASIDTACGGATALTLGTATDGTLAAGDSLFVSACGLGGAPEKLYSLTAPSDGALVVSLTSDDDLGVSLRTTCDSAASELSCADSVVGGATEHLVQPVTSGDALTLIVDGFQPGREGDFTVTANVVPLQTESEPNDGALGSDPVTLTGGIGLISAATTPTDDNDWFSFTLTTAAVVHLETASFGASTCGGDIDTNLELYQVDGVTLIDSNDDISGFGNFCSAITTTDPLPPGIYGVHVSKSPTATDPTLTYEYMLEIFTQ